MQLVKSKNQKSRTGGKMAKKIQITSNCEQRLMSEIKSIAKKISRNISKGYQTEKLEKAFNEKKLQAEAKGLKIKDYAMFVK